MVGEIELGAVLDRRHRRRKVGDADEDVAFDDVLETCTPSESTSLSRRTALESTREEDAP